MIDERLENIKTGIETTKSTLAQNLRGVGVAASDTETLTQLAAKVAEADEWHPNPYWQSLDDIADGQIGFIVRDTNEYGEPAKLCLYVGVVSGQYRVDWGDGTIDLVDNAVSCIHEYAIGGGAPDGHGYTTYKIRISAVTTSLLRFQSMTSSGAVFTPSTMLYVRINAPTMTTISSSFLDCHLLEAVGDLYLPNCTAATYCFNNCTRLRKIGNIYLGGNGVQMTYFFGACPLLESVGDINITNCTSFYGMFQYCGSLRQVGVISSNTAVGAPYLFQACFNLKSIQSINLPNVNDARLMFLNVISLISIPDLQNLGSNVPVFDGLNFLTQSPYKGVVNMPNTKFSKLDIIGVASRRSGISGVFFSSESPFGGAAPQINLNYTSLSRVAIVSVFNQLPTLSGKQISITGCTGAAELTAGDLAIATGKGWTVVQ